MFKEIFGQKLDQSRKGLSEYLKKGGFFGCAIDLGRRKSPFGEKAQYFFYFAPKGMPNDGRKRRRIPLHR